MITEVEHICYLVSEAFCQARWALRISTFHPTLIHQGSEVCLTDPVIPHDEFSELEHSTLYSQCKTIVCPAILQIDLGKTKKNDIASWISNLKGRSPSASREK